jgi:glycosyltransferase involved in cell wall biosynthesis
MKPPDISIVMGVYNGIDSLQESLESLLTQTGPSLELIVVDDGSSDGSGRLLDRIAKQDDRLHVIHQQNMGLTRSLIAGCTRASADWIARQDADEISLPGRMEALWKLHQEHPDAVLLATSVQVVGPEQEPLYQALRPTDPDLARRQVRDLGIGPAAHGSVMFSRAAYRAVGGYRAEFYCGQDVDLWLRLSEHGGVAYTDQIFYRCSLRPGSITGAQWKTQRAFGRLSRQCRDARRAGRSETPLLARGQALSQRLRRRPARTFPRFQALSYYHIASLLEASDPAGAAGYYRKAIECRFWSWKAHAKLCRLQWRAWRGRTG